MSYTTSYGPFFLAGMVFTITLAGHEPWDHHAPHEQAPDQVVVYTTPITTPTSGSFSFSTVSSAVVASGFPSLVFRV
jgi:hypothetical protein